MAATFIKWTKEEQLSLLCGNGLWKLLNCMEEWQFSTAMILWTEGKFWNRWKDSNEGGQALLAMLILSDHRL